ncbi:UNVERIFIED_CONTAM: hypothetical protein FKN15_044447 [Acipenser sinensis]
MLFLLDTADGERGCGRRQWKTTSLQTSERQSEAARLIKFRQKMNNYEYACSFSR